MTAEITLDDLERDALTELVNIGVGRAASGLRKMVKREVLLSVPVAEVVDRGIAASLIAQQESESLTAVQQDFHGAFEGQALLIFPESNAHHLARAVLDEGFAESDVIELRDEVLAETGNIILGACLSSIANMLRHSLQVSAPTVRRGTSKILFDVSRKPAGESFVLFLHINFSVQDRQINGKREFLGTFLF